MRLDSYGMIVQLDGDPEDQMNREGFFGFYSALRVKLGMAPMDVPGKIPYSQAVSLLCNNGIWKRHMGAQKWEVSRDQLLSNIAAMGAHRLYTPLRKTLWQQIKNFGRCQNGDWMAPNHFGMYIRAFGKPGLWPMLLFSDVFMVISALINIYKSTDPGYSDDSVNFTVELEQAKHFLPTPISYLARKLYYRYRRRPNIVYEDWMDIPTIRNPAVQALFYYFSPIFGGNIELAWLAESVIMAGERK